MKSIEIRIKKSSHWVAMLLAAVVAIITTAVVANATQTITTPNAVNISFNLAVGTSSAAITPAPSKPVLVMGGCTTSGFFGIGQVSLLHISGGGVRWVGLESEPTAAITQGASATAGDHIVWISSSHLVGIQVAGVGDTILIHNGDSGTRAGNVTLVW